MTLRLISKGLLLSVIFAIGIDMASPVFARRRVVRGIAAAQDPEISVNLNRLPENSRMYSLVISDSDERVISGNFSIERLQILKAIMTEAEKFAYTSEGVGTKEPITTRFADQHEPAFICDVQKIGVESSFFLTFNIDDNSSTLNAGKYFRSTRREQGMFFDLLTRLEAILPKSPTKP